MDDLPLIDESSYSSMGLVKTIGTVFMKPPDESELMELFRRPFGSVEHTPSCGTRALCKHYDRRPDHPFWSRPSGAPKAKDILAERVLRDLLETATWRNIFHLNRDVILYEIRNPGGYGARWNLHPTRFFRGFVEPNGQVPNY